MYWDNRDKTRATLPGRVDEERRQVLGATRDGYYIYAGRSDDMLKVGGIYVSPFEVEAALMHAPGRARSGGDRQPDEDELIKPKAFVVLKTGSAGDDALADELQGVREGPARAVQVSALDRVHRRAAEDRDRQDPALQAARARERESPCQQSARSAQEQRNDETLAITA